MMSKGLVILYTLLGLAVSTTSLFISYLCKMLINTVVASEYQGFVLLAVVYGLGIVMNIATSAEVSRLCAEITVYVNNDIQEGTDH